MYHQTPSKKQLARQIAIYVLMTTTVIVTVFLLIMFMLGYRFNQATGTIEQGGLVQFRSIPSDATVAIDSLATGGSTPSKSTVLPGVRQVSVSKSGYQTWTKAVDVESGRILWLNYIRLIPDDLTVEDSVRLPGIASSLASPNRQQMAIATSASIPTIALVDIRKDTPEVETLELPEDSYTATSNQSTQSYDLISWDSSSRYILLKHQYDKTVEWIVVDTEDVSRSRNVTTLFDIQIADIKFSNDNPGIFYALVNNDIRRIDIEDATVSAPLVRDVAEFSLFGRSTIAYVTTANKETSRRSVGYYTKGASEARIIRSYSDEASSRNHHISIGEYFNKTYVAISYGNTTDILSGPLPKSDSDRSLSLSAVITISLADPVDYLSTRAKGRLFVIQHKNNYTVYDTETGNVSTTAIEGSGSIKGQLRWADDYSVWSSLGGRLRLYEFDGTNRHDIMPIIPGQSAVISPNNRYIYAPTKTKSGEFYLSRVKAIK